MKRPNLSLSDNLDLALTLAARQQKLTKSRLTELALREYLMKNFAKECQTAGILEKLIRDGAMTGYIKDLPVYIDDEGYLFGVAEGQQTRVRDTGRYWKAKVKDGKWQYTYLKGDVLLDDDWDAISESGPTYEPGEYEEED